MARRLFPTRSGKICSSPHSFSWPLQHALCTLVRSVQRAGRTLRSFKRCRSPITSSCGFTRLLSFLPPSMETPALLIGPVVVIVGLLLLPFLSGEGEKSWRRRPIAVLTVLLIAITLGTFTHLAGFTPWSPHMNAWSGDPVPERVLAWHHGTSAARSSRLSGQAMPQLPFAR